MQELTLATKIIDYTIDEAELFVRISLVKLGWGPHSYSEALRRHRLSLQLLSIARLDRRLLYRREIFYKTVRQVIEMYKDPSRTQDEHISLALIAAELRANEWSSDAASGVFQIELSQIRHTDDGSLQKRMEKIVNDDLIWDMPPTTRYIGGSIRIRADVKSEGSSRGYLD